MFNIHNSRHPTYLNLHLITCTALGVLGLHRIYRFLQKFTPLFEQFTKIYVIYGVNCIWPPTPPPLFPGLRCRKPVQWMKIISINAQMQILIPL